ncbi:MAG: delta(1)-pyrroline-2-carboxylate reductase family protein [Acetobacter sp.]
MHILSAHQTRQVLPFRPLMDMLRSVVRSYYQGHIVCPERLVVPTHDRQGLVMSMVACGADILAHKLLTIFPHNTDLPTIQGQVTCLDAKTGRFLFALDGITTTERRTAAMSMLGLECFCPPRLKHVLLIGTGAQARVHLEALNTLYPGLHVFVRGRTAKSVQALLDGPYTNLHLQAAPQKPDVPYDLVLAVTSSKDILFDQDATPETLVIGVGAYRPDMIEIGPRIVQQSLCVVDDPVGAPTEAGDLIQANKDWSEVRALAEFLDNAAQRNAPALTQPVFFKSVGCAAWDLAACRLVHATMPTL